MTKTPATISADKAAASPANRDGMRSLGTSFESAPPVEAHTGNRPFMVGSERNYGKKKGNGNGRL